MSKKNNINNLTNYMSYFFTILSVTVFLITFLTLKNECQKNKNEITLLKQKQIHYTDLVKELLSRKENLLSEEHILSKLSDMGMVAVAPETLQVFLRTEKK